MQRIHRSGMLAMKEDRELLPNPLSLGLDGSFEQSLLSFLRQIAPTLGHRVTKC